MKSCLLLPIGLLTTISTVFAQTSNPVPATAEPAPAIGGTPAAPSRPQPAQKPFLTVGGFSLSGYLRARYEHTEWFNTPGFNDSYSFTGTQVRLAGVRSTPKLDIQLDIQGTLLGGVPNDAIAPPPQGPLGLGGNYYAANGAQDGSVYVRQAFVRFKGLAGTGSSARLGRFEYADGTETVNKNPTLNFLKTQRIAQRVVGTFAFTQAGRAFDGGQISLPSGKNGNFTAVVARPTEGVFSVKGNDNIDGTGFAYGAFSKSKTNSDFRIFGQAYQDVRSVPKSVKVDNRPLAVRQADGEAIRVYTIGANYLKTFDSKAGTVDLLGWGALQGGEWGTLRHRANALDLEVGYQPKNAKLRPWLRAGYYRASGDGNPNDGTHGTFFTPLTTPRLYARFPYYNQMNIQDVFAQLLLRPNPKTNLRFEAHNLKLASASDLWYQGGGAFTDNGFGLIGRPSNGNSALGNMLDASFDYNFDPQTSIGLYYGYALGGKVTDSVYPASNNASFGFLEFTRRF